MRTKKCKSERKNANKRKKLQTSLKKKKKELNKVRI